MGQSLGPGPGTCLVDLLPPGILEPVGPRAALRAFGVLSATLGEVWAPLVSVLAAPGVSIHRRCQPLGRASPEQMSCSREP